MSAEPLLNGDEILFKAEVAAALRCSEKTVDRLILDGALKAGKRRGRVVVLKSSLLEYVGTMTTSTK